MYVSIDILIRYLEFIMKLINCCMHTYMYHLNGYQMKPGERKRETVEESEREWDEAKLLRKLCMYCIVLVSVRIR